MGKPPGFAVTSVAPLRLTVLVAFSLVSVLSSWKPALALPIHPTPGLSSPQDDIFSVYGGMEDCDWIGMTKRSVVADGSVQQEYLRCPSGRIKWLYPDGALRVTIHPPQPHYPIVSLPKKIQNKIRRSLRSDHRACLTVDRKTFHGVNVYLQDKQALKLIFASSPQKPVLADGHPSNQVGVVKNSFTDRFGSHSNLVGVTNQAGFWIKAQVEPTVTISNQGKTDMGEATSAERRCFDLPNPSVTLYLESFPEEESDIVSVASEDVDNPRLRTHVRRPGVGAVEIVYDIAPAV
ncbi:hypothetical protein RvY_16723 [Ramazzottius varieornatus]|uniref:Uncharacterized protein n=1 Tax=Ramazzottius varieornatus TaxID=947166 RepID=A0A1D1VZJ3_RAMVA|nr:hypothetical protein RvY_16723 [Ramazzottius varieornatus]